MDRNDEASRERVTKWVEDGVGLFGLLPALLGGDEQARTRAEAAEQELERLRKEVADLKRETQQLRTERDEIKQEFSKFMEPIAQRLGLKKSPFERQGPGAPTPAAPPA